MRTLNYVPLADKMWLVSALAFSKPEGQKRIAIVKDAFFRKRGLDCRNSVVQKPHFAFNML